MTNRYPIGAYRSVELEVAAWDGAGADADLSVACLFSHEPPGTDLSGGALHLDTALGGALTRFRGEGRFKAGAGETMLLRPSPPRTVSPQLLIVGLGPPDRWTPAVSGAAAALAVDWAIALDLASLAFAPSLLDAGMSGAGTTIPMLSGVVAAIDRAAAFAEAQLTPPLKLHRFSFDAGPTHAAEAASGFAQALPELAAASTGYG